MSLERLRFSPTGEYDEIIEDMNSAVIQSTGADHPQLENPGAHQPWCSLRGEKPSYPRASYSVLTSQGWWDWLWGSWEVSKRHHLRFVRLRPWERTSQRMSYPSKLVSGWTPPTPTLGVPEPTTPLAPAPFCTWSQRPFFLQPFMQVFLALVKAKVKPGQGWFSDVFLFFLCCCYWFGFFFFQLLMRDTSLVLVSTHSQ